MYLIFGRNHHIGSLAIRLGTISRWSHCGIIDGDYVIESVFPNGVTKTHINDFVKRYTCVEVCKLPVFDNLKAMELARTTKGKYDIKGAVSSILPLRSGFLNDKDKWFCSEHVAYCSGMFRDSFISGITPNDVYIVAKTVDDKEYIENLLNRFSAFSNTKFINLSVDLKIDMLHS